MPTSLRAARSEASPISPGPHAAVIITTCGERPRPDACKSGAVRWANALGLPMLPLMTKRPCMDVVQCGGSPRAGLWWIGVPLRAVVLGGLARARRLRVAAAVGGRHRDRDEPDREQRCDRGW